MLPRACDQLVRSQTAPDRCVRCDHPSDAHRQRALEPKAKTTKIWGDTIRPEVCSSANCRQQIYFAQMVTTGKWMPFDARPVALSVQPEIGTNRQAWVVSLATSHFATCRSAASFRRRR